MTRSKAPGRKWALRTSTWTAAAVLLVLLTGHARAEDRPEWRLVYVRDRGAEICPERARLASAVQARLGYLPFAAETDSAVEDSGRPTASDLPTASVVVRRVDDQLVASFTFEGAGRERRDHTLAARAGDCAELIEALGLSLAVAIDPMVLIRPPPAPPKPPAAAPPSSAIARTETPHPPSTCPPPPKLDLSVWSGLSFGVLPSAAWGIGAGFGVSRARLSVATEVRVDFPASSTNEAGRGAEASLVLASIVPCLNERGVFLCGLLSAGTLFGRAIGIEVPERDESFYASVGARLGIDVRLGERLDLRGMWDLRAPLRHTELRVDGIDAWSTPVLGTSLGLGLHRAW